MLPILNKAMGINTSLLFSDPCTLFSLGTAVGATTAYIFLRNGRKSLANKEVCKEIPIEEQFEFPESKEEIRLVMAVRNDLKMQKGKVAAQCSHAAVAAYAKALKSKPKTLARWSKYGATKITVKIDSEEELLALDKLARSKNVLSSVIRDAGQTQVAPGTRTVIAIGPAPKSALDLITGHLKLY